MNIDALITLSVNYLFLLIIFLAKKMFDQNSTIYKAIQIDFFLSVLLKFLSISFGILAPFGMLFANHNFTFFEEKVNLTLHLIFIILIQLTPFVIMMTLSIKYYVKDMKI
jgi:hypothetical protein